MLHHFFCNYLRSTVYLRFFVDRMNLFFFAKKCSNFVFFTFQFKFHIEIIYMNIFFWLKEICKKRGKVLERNSRFKECDEICRIKINFRSKKHAQKTTEKSFDIFSYIGGKAEWQKRIFMNINCLSNQLRNVFFMSLVYLRKFWKRFLCEFLLKGFSFPFNIDSLRNFILFSSGFRWRVFWKSTLAWIG